MNVIDSTTVVHIFAGDEFYLKEWPQVEGYSFREVLTSFPSATPIGIKEQSTERVVLNPEDTYIIQKGRIFLVPDMIETTLLLPCWQWVTSKQSALLWNAEY